MATTALDKSVSLNECSATLRKVPPTETRPPLPLQPMHSKRTIDLVSDHDDEVDAMSEPDLSGMYVDKNCDEVRRLIRNHIESGEMKVGEFQKKIGVSGPAYGRFMAQGGRDKGCGCDTYIEAWKFFKKRELQGIKMSTKKRPKTSLSSAAAAQGADVKKAGSETTNGKDLSNIHLDGEEDDEVPVYDTCDEIRRKISAHLRKEGIVVAAFLRDLHAQYHTAKSPTKIQSAQLSSFRNKKGPSAGNTSCIFYASYCFFEKLRIAEGKKKSTKRLDMEGIYGYAGMDVTHVTTNRGYICAAGSTIYEDSYGQIRSV